MVSQHEQAELICGLYAAGGYVYERFTSAANIESNFKIMLPEALERNPKLRTRFVGHFVNELAGVEVIAAVGGGIYIAREVASEMDLQLIEVESVQKEHHKDYQISHAAKRILKSGPKVGFLEDVSSTRQTVARSVQSTQLYGLVVKGVSGWRRGIEAPEGMSVTEILEHCRRFPEEDIYEVPLPFPMSNIIERKAPLWLPSEDMIRTILPELVAV